MGYADLIEEDKDLLRHLASRAKTWRQFHFFNLLFVSIPVGEERDYQVMRQRRRPRVLALPFPHTPEEIACEARRAVRPPRW